MTPPRETIDRPRTNIFIEKNEDGNMKQGSGFKRMISSNSCGDVFTGRTTKLTLTLQDKNLALHFDTKDTLHYPCINVYIICI